VKRPFNLLDQFPNIVVAETRPQSQGPGFYFERRSRCSLAASAQTDPQIIIDYLLKGLSQPASLLTKLVANVIVESESGSHALMLIIKHHDVNAEAKAKIIHLRRAFAGHGGSTAWPPEAKRQWDAEHGANPYC
jgi:hypothetical protein